MNSTITYIIYFVYLAPIYLWVSIISVMHMRALLIEVELPLSMDFAIVCMKWYACSLDIEFNFAISESRPYPKCLTYFSSERIRLLTIERKASEDTMAFILRYPTESGNYFAAIMIEVVKSITLKIRDFLYTSLKRG